MSAYLTINNIEVIYDHVILVLKGVSLDVPQGKIVALLGANGAGKTTTLKAISNLLRAERGEVTKGDIQFKSQRIDQLTPNDLVKGGVIQVMEGRHCFAHLTVEENLLTGAYTRAQSRADLKASLEKVYQYFPRLKQRRTSQSGYTSGGEQQMTAIGRALMANPEMILLDEPSMGLAPQIVEEIFEIVRDLNQREKVSFLLAEQNTMVALRYADFGYILENGRVVMEGEAAELRNNEDVKEFYLGLSSAAAARASAKSNTTAAASAGWHEREHLDDWKRATRSGARCDLMAACRRKSRMPRRTPHCSADRCAASIRRTVTSRAALARLPVVRKHRADSNCKSSTAPLAGWWRPAAGQLGRVFSSPGPIYEPGRAGQADYWRFGRALFAAGFRAGDLVHNTFSYHLTPAGFMARRRCAPLGCRSSPAASARPSSRCRRWPTCSRWLRWHAELPAILLDKADELRPKMSVANQGAGVRRGLLAGAEREAFAARGIAGYQAYAHRRSWLSSPTKRRRAKGWWSTRT